MSLGHHAMLRFPDEGGNLCTAPFLFGQVSPEPIESPEKRGYSLLETGATFSSLGSVKTNTGQIADLTRYPARRGYEDLVMLVTDPSVRMGWTAVTFPSKRFVWFALKDTSVLPNTVMWMSNGGRHYTPWNGRHVNVLGLEETNSYFHFGLSESAKANAISDRGWPTHAVLRADMPTTVNYIFDVAPIPEDVEMIDAIERSKNGIAIMSGKTCIEVPLDLDFLFGKDST